MTSYLNDLNTQQSIDERQRPRDDSAFHDEIEAHERRVAGGEYRTDLADPRRLSFLREREGRLVALLMDMEQAEQQRTMRRHALSVLNDELSAISDDIRQRVADETCENGKPRYSNIESRAVAASQALRADAQAQRLQKRIGELDAEIDELSMQFDAARRERQSIHTVLEFSAAWLGWYSSSNKERE